MNQQGQSREHAQARRQHAPETHDDAPAGARKPPRAPRGPPPVKLVLRGVPSTATPTALREELENLAEAPLVWLRAYGCARDAAVDAAADDDNGDGDDRDGHESEDQAMGVREGEEDGEGRDESDVGTHVPETPAAPVTYTGRVYIGVRAAADAVALADAVAACGLAGTGGGQVTAEWAPYQFVPPPMKRDRHEGRIEQDAEYLQFVAKLKEDHARTEASGSGATNVDAAGVPLAGGDHDAATGEVVTSLMHFLRTKQARASRRGEKASKAAARKGARSAHQHQQQRVGKDKQHGKGSTKGKVAQKQQAASSPRQQHQVHPQPQQPGRRRGGDGGAQKQSAAAPVVMVKRKSSQPPRPPSKLQQQPKESEAKPQQAKQNGGGRPGSAKSQGSKPPPSLMRSSQDKAKGQAPPVVLHRRPEGAAQPSSAKQPNAAPTLLKRRPTAS